ncbi:hypothetical protein [Microcoleus sp.]|uniref:hypothetical protein n=1 Tax=Microcoleus sp. TaxID=44472 RepID=UPI00403E9E07
MFEIVGAFAPNTPWRLTEARAAHQKGWRSGSERVLAREEESVMTVGNGELVIGNGELLIGNWELEINSY